MGYRSTLTSQHYSPDIPEWFKEKYQNYYFIRGTLVSSKGETKHYANDFFEDYQKALIEAGLFSKNLKEVVIVVLGESGAVTKVVIYRDAIKYYFMIEDVEADGVYIA